jgi:hypothetical protein
MVWPVIRHIRYLYRAWRTKRDARLWGRRGVGLGVPTPAERDELEAIRRGEN